MDEQIKKTVYDPNGEYLKLAFSDNGIGFDPAHGTKIFDVFKRLHPEWEYGGMVIGLAIVKKIAQYHGGAVVASGTTGAGAVFKLYLPVDRREDPKADRTFMASPMV